MTAITAFDRLIDALREHGSTVTVNGDKATAQCPSHDDGRASLSIGTRRDGKGLVVYCHGGCRVEDIVAAAGLAMTDLFDDPRMRAAYNGHNVYDYPDGRKVHRKPAKQFDGIAATSEIKVVAVGKDAADHIAAGKTLDELVSIEADDDPDPVPLT